MAPPSIQKTPSYLVGCAANYAWQVFLSSATHASVSVVQGLITLYHPDFLLSPWQQGLLVILLITIMAAFNLGLLDYMPDLEFIVLGVHILAFGTFEITMLVTGPGASAAQVFQNFEILTIARQWAVVAHMAEELENAIFRLPSTIVVGGHLNYLLGFIMLKTLFSRAENIQQALQENPATPFLATLEDITGSKTAACIMGVYIAFASFFGATKLISTASRRLYAFSRHGGLSFRTRLRKVTTSGVPFNASFATWTFNVILALILTSPTIAFRIIGGLAEPWSCQVT